MRTAKPPTVVPVVTPPPECIQFPSGVATGVAYALTSTYDINRYHLGTSLCQNPIDPKTIVAITSNGAQHTYTDDKFLCLFKSTDFGISWGARNDFYNPPGVGIATQGNCAGYDSSGRLHVICTIMSGAGTYLENRYIYSDDDGTTWSVPVALTTPPLSSYLVIGNIVEANGVLIACLYGSSATPTYSRYVYRSTDFGVTWALVLVTYSGSNYINESAVVWLTGAKWLMLSRTEYAPYEFMQTISLDNGLTWTDQGQVNFYTPNPTNNIGPPVLKNFDLNGVRVIVCYFLDRVAYKISAIYATAANLSSLGLTGWDSSTTTLIVDDTLSVHYGDVCHYNNNFNSYAMFSKEITDPWTTTHNTLIHQTFPSTQYDSVKTALGIA